MVFYLVVIVLLFLFDVEYYLRIVTLVLRGRLCEGNRKMTDIVTLNGFHYLPHVRGSQYARILDRALIYLYDRTGLYMEMAEMNSFALPTATTVLHGGHLPMFSSYKVTSQVIFWDELSIYFEQKFITPDNVVRRATMTKATMSRPQVHYLMELLESGPKPELSEDLRLWIESLEVSSKRLRPDKQD